MAIQYKQGVRQVNVLFACRQLLYCKDKDCRPKEILIAELSASQVFLPVRAVSIVAEFFVSILLSLYNSAILCAILCVCIGTLQVLCAIQCAILCVCIGTLET